MLAEENEILSRARKEFPLQPNIMSALSPLKVCKNSKK
jgi:hypothetical protein